MVVHRRLLGAGANPRDSRGGSATLAVIARLRPMHLKRVLLATHDAHEVYTRVGFVAIPNPDTLMVLDPDLLSRAEKSAIS
jgi:hypothetical protein